MIIDATKGERLRKLYRLQSVNDLSEHKKQLICQYIKNNSDKKLFLKSIYESFKLFKYIICIHI